MEHISNPPEQSSSSSLFDDCCPWTCDWSSSLKGEVSKEACSSSSLSDDPQSIVFKENGSWSSGSGYPYSLSSGTSNTDQDICRNKNDRTIKKVVGGGISRLNYLPADKMMFRSVQDFDQQDWELKLREHGCENEFHADSILSISKNGLEKLVDEKD